MGTRGLIAAKLATLPVGEHGDGGYLYFIVEAGAGGATNRRFSIRFPAPDGSGRAWKKLGNFPTMGLKEARLEAVKLGRLIAQGIDPRNVGKPTSPALGAFIATHLAAWTAGKSEGHTKNWRVSIDRMIGTKLYDRPVADITISEVIEWVTPIWNESPIVGERTLGFLAQVMGSAIALEIREKANPAAWSTIKKTNLLRPARELRPVVNHPAMAHADVPAFVKLLAYEIQTNRIAGSCVLFTILCGLRNSEARLARWSWLNADMSVMTIPAEIMKGREDHIVPLATQTIELLRSLPRTGELIFPSTHTYGEHKEMADKALRRVVHRVPGGESVTVHGFRSSFREWTTANTREEDWLLELCLAHAPGGKVRAAYQRDRALDERRRAVMQAWADHVTGKVPAGTVLPFRRVA